MKIEKYWKAGKTDNKCQTWVKTICRESKCKSRAELAKLAWAIMPRYSFAYSKKKIWALCVSHQLQSVILVVFFSLCLKRGYRKKKDRSDVSDFILKGAALYAERFVGFAFVRRDSG